MAPPFSMSSTTSLRCSCRRAGPADRKSTRLNSSHQIISYAVFCLKKKKKRAESSDNNVSNAAFGLEKRCHDQRCPEMCPATVKELSHQVLVASDEILLLESYHRR